MNVSGAAGDCGYNLSSARTMLSARSSAGLLWPSRMRLSCFRDTPATFASAERFTSFNRRLSSSELTMSDYASDVSHGGQICATFLTRHVGNTSRVDKSARALVSASLSKLLEGAKSRRSWAIERRLDPKSVERAVKGAVGYAIDYLDDLTKATGMEAWQLLRPDTSDKTFADLTWLEAKIVELVRSAGFSRVEQERLVALLQSNDARLVSLIRTSEPPSKNVVERPVQNVSKPRHTLAAVKRGKGNAQTSGRGVRKKG
jgi:hypothetical protein